MNILLLDDDPLILKGLGKALRREGYNVITAERASLAIEIAKEDLLDLLICDVRMPEGDGIEALGSLRRMQGGMRAIVITGYASDDAPIRAVKSGVDDYLLKPFPIQALLRSVHNSLELRRLELRAKTDLEAQRRSLLALVTTLVNLFLSRDSYFQDHARKVASLAVDLAAELGLEGESLDRLELAGLLHDIGLATVDRAILLKPQLLDEAERAVIARQPQAARKLLAGVSELDAVAHIIEHLKESYGGGGLPRGLRSEAIPLESRILRVAEAFDSLTSDRPQRPAFTVEEALLELERESGATFDPGVVALCASLARENRELVDPARLLSRAGGSQSRRERVQSLSVLANLLRQSGQTQEAGHAYDQAQELLRGEQAPELQVAVHIGKAQACLAAGSGPQAARWAASARHELEKLPQRQGRSVLDLARIFLALERKDTAREVLSWFPEHDSLDEERARVELRIALAEGNSELFRSAFPGWWRDGAAAVGLGPGDARESCGVLLGALRISELSPLAERGLATLVSRFEHLRKVILAKLPEGYDAAFLPASSPSAASAAEGSSSSARAVLEIRLLGPLQVSYGGAAISPKAWTTRKARELFSLLAYHRRPVAAGRLEELLWPQGGDGTRTNLHTTVSRVRRALRQVVEGARNVIGAEGDFYFLDSEMAQWCDVREFESLAQQVVADAAGPLSEAKLRAATACMALYQGDFLEGIWEDWTFQPRTNLREVWFALATRLAEHYLSTDNARAADHVFQDMVARDACREEAHLGLMRSALKAGRRDQAKARYHAYSDALKKEMGMEPSAQARGLYLEIMGKPT